MSVSVDEEKGKEQEVMRIGEERESEGRGGEGGKGGNV